jgi:hypothetical protein
MDSPYPFLSGFYLPFAAPNTAVSPYPAKPLLEFISPMNSYRCLGRPDAAPSRRSQKSKG